MFHGAPVQQARITQAIRTLPPEISGLFILMDRQKHYQGNPANGIPALTHFFNRKRLPRGMLTILSQWFFGNDCMKESRPEWGEYFATLRGIRGGEMRVSMKVAGDGEAGGVEVSVDVEIIHSLDDEISV